MNNNSLSDQFAASFRPPSLLLRSSYFDYGSKPSPFFALDAAVFNRFPLRRSFIALAGVNEFDMSLGGPHMGSELKQSRWLSSFGTPTPIMLDILQHVPPLHVLVSWISEDVHQVTALYRGNAFWKTQPDVDGRVQIDAYRSDPELETVLSQISKVEGFSVDSWQRFTREFERIINTPNRNIHLI